MEAAGSPAPLPPRRHRTRPSLKAPRRGPHLAAVPEPCGPERAGGGGGEGLGTKGRPWLRWPGGCDHAKAPASASPSPGVALSGGLPHALPRDPSVKRAAEQLQAVSLDPPRLPTGAPVAGTRDPRETAVLVLVQQVPSVDLPAEPGKPADRHEPLPGPTVPTRHHATRFRRFAGTTSPDSA